MIVLFAALVICTAFQSELMFNLLSSEKCTFRIAFSGLPVCVSRSIFFGSHVGLVPFEAYRIPVHRFA